MKSMRVLTIGVLFLVALAVPVVFTSPAGAQSRVVVGCWVQEELDQESICDVGLIKEVSVNGGAFVDADTSPEAAQATIGDNVVWRVTVTDNSSSGLIALGLVGVLEKLPIGFTLNSSSATIGTYASDVWIFDFAESDDGYVSNLPAVLTLNTTASGVGLVENVATLGQYSCCEEWAEYEDDATGNNENSAWVQVSGAPVVLGESTTATPQVLGLADTGSSVVQSAVAGLLIITTLAVIVISRPKTSQ